jgi:hypothetical protein
LHSFQIAFWVAAGMAGAGLVCACFMRPFNRRTGTSDAADLALT